MYKRKSVLKISTVIHSPKCVSEHACVNDLGDYTVFGLSL